MLPKRVANLASLEFTAHTLHATILDVRNAVFRDILLVRYPPNIDHHIYADTVRAHHPLLLRTLIDARVDAVAYSERPGIPAVLLEGKKIVRSVSAALRVPTLGVDHCVAHIESVRALNRVETRFVGIHIAGGNTVIYEFVTGRGFGTYREVWRIHPGVGWLLDEVAKALGDVPRIVGGVHVAHRLLSDTEPAPEAVRELFKHIAAGRVRLALLVARKRGLRWLRSLIEAAYTVVARVALEASTRIAASTAIVGGGVSLCPVLRSVLSKRFRNLIASPPELARDNAYMIAATAMTRARRGHVLEPPPELVEALTKLVKHGSSEHISAPATA